MLRRYPGLDKDDRLDQLGEKGYMATGAKERTFCALLQPRSENALRNSAVKSNKHGLSSSSEYVLYTKDEGPFSVLDRFVEDGQSGVAAEVYEIHSITRWSGLTTLFVEKV